MDVRRKFDFMRIMANDAKWALLYGKKTCEKYKKATMREPFSKIYKNMFSNVLY